MRQLLTNVKDKDEPNDRQGAVYKIKCCDCQATYIGETGRNLNTRLTEHKRATRNGDLNNNITEHHLQTNHRIDWDSAECVIYSTDYYQRLTLEGWFTNLEQTPLNRCQQLPAPYKPLINDCSLHKLILYNVKLQKKGTFKNCLSINCKKLKTKTLPVRTCDSLGDSRDIFNKPGCIRTGCNAMYNGSHTGP